MTMTRTPWHFFGGLACAAALAGCGSAPPAPGPQRLLDDFESAAAWQAGASDQVSATLRSERGAQGRALCLDYDFKGVSGYAYLERRLPIDFPAHYALRLQWRGSAPANDLQLKFVDASGDNVWWRQLPRAAPPAEWQPLLLRQRQIEFAWGPAKDRTLRRTERLQLVVASATGGKGSVCFDELALQTLPAPTLAPAVAATASSQLGGKSGPALAVDYNPATAWEAEAAPGRPVQFTLDLGRVREYGGLILNWRPGKQATRYEVEASDDGRRWTLLRRITDGRAALQPIWLPEGESRYLRLNLREGLSRSYALQEAELQPVAFGASPNAMLQTLAQRSPRGHYPRGYSGEQAYWTLVGVDGGGAHAALMSEDGAVEVGKGGFSIEPFVLAPGGLVSWAHVRATQSLHEGYLPIPSVTWEHPSLRLQVTALASGTRGQSQLATRYRLTNTSTSPQRLSLALAVRPLQVNPPAQFLNTAGGWRALRHLAWDGRTLQVDRITPVRSSVAPTGVVLMPFDAGPIADALAEADSTLPVQVDDSAEGGVPAASGALVYRWTLAPGETRSVVVSAPLSGELTEGKEVKDDWQPRHDAVAAEWQRRLGHVGLSLPRQGQHLEDSLRSALAHMLISRDGPALQPGTRAYARSWVRDGAMMAEGLLRLGEHEPVREFAEWFAPHQFDSGKVPCCVDHRGADPVPENDSHGQFIHTVAELYRHTHDRAMLKRLWPRVDKALAYMERLRQSERIDANRQGARRAYFGLMPASISHEGYAAKPVHSYWDAFWALRGYKDAVELAEALGEKEAAQRNAAWRDEFQRELHASIAQAVAQHRITYLPGAAELGDFDPSATAIALAPGGEQVRLPSALLHETYERYWREFTHRRDRSKSWDDYTPYELRNVGALLRLGQPQRAHEALRWFFEHQRPAGWNQWAEVVGRDARKLRFVGDMPHAWIASDYIRAALDLLAYERQDDDASLVLGAGVPPQWLDEGVSVKGLRTPYGPLSYTLKRVGREVRLDVAGGLRMPPGGLHLAWGWGALPLATVNGQPARWQGRELRIDRLPARVVLR